MEKFENISKEKSIELIKIIKKYANLFKSLYHIDPASASEFKRKQELYYNEKHKNKQHKHNHTKENNSSCCGGKLDSKIYIPKDKMNNIEKNLNEFYETFYYQSNIEELLIYLNEKFEKITKSGLKDGMTLDESTEKDLTHRLLLEGIPFYICEKMKKKLKSYEESISEQPMLLAHPSSITNKELINFIDSKYVSELINNDYTVVNKKIFPDLNEYELFNQMKYIYLEGHYEDLSQNVKLNNCRSDFLFKFSTTYFKKSKHQTIYNFTKLAYYLPYELNYKYSYFNLQTNDYMQISYFRENHSEINFAIDSSFEEGKDTGKKLTALYVLFPDELELTKRKLQIILKNQKDFINEENSENEINIEITNPLSLVIIKSRKIGYKIPQHSFPFIILFYYMHGPIDKSNYSC